MKNSQPTHRPFTKNANEFFMIHLGRIWQMGVTTLFLICCASVLAQWQKKPATEWSDSDTQKVLHDSPWVKSQEIANRNATSTPPPARSDNPIGTQGTLPDPSRIYNSAYTVFRVRLLSAKPIREALKRNKLVQQTDERLNATLESLISSGPGDYIVVAVGHETKTGSGGRQFESQLLPSSLSPSDPETFLEVRGGQRIPLHAYQLGGRLDIRLGALFIFKRFADGKPVITGDSGELRFRTKFRSGYRRSQSDIERFTIDVTFKVKHLLYEGNLEF